MPPDPPRRPGPGAVRGLGPVSLDRAAALVDLMVQGIPPPQLQALIDSVAAGCGLRLYIPINKLLRARGLAPKAGQMKRQRPDWH